MSLSLGFCLSPTNFPAKSLFFVAFHFYGAGHYDFTRKTDEGKPSSDNNNNDNNNNNNNNDDDDDDDDDDGNDETFCKLHILKLEPLTCK